MNGYEALGKLRGHSETAHIPVIALSAEAMANDIKRGLEAGFDSYLTKPINVEELTNTIARILAAG